MPETPVALQLYSIREECSKDLSAVLPQVAEMGYDGVEFAGFFDIPAKDLRQMLDDCGLRCAGSHTPIAHLDDEHRAATAEYNRTLGNRYLIVPGLPEEYRSSADAWRRTADTFNALAETLAAEDMQTGYHNHFHEFTPLDGQVPWDIFFGNTDERVIMQVDTGNAREGGADAVSLLQKYPGRAVTVHLKEWTDDPGGAVIGEGKLDWTEVFDACDAGGTTQWYIVEQEQYPVPPMDSVRKCVENVRRLRSR